MQSTGSLFARTINNSHDPNAGVVEYIVEAQEAGLESWAAPVYEALRDIVAGPATLTLSRASV